MEGRYDYDKGFDDTANEPVGNAFVEAYRCPSAPAVREMEAINIVRLTGQAGVRAQPTDYFGIRGIRDPSGENEIVHAVRVGARLEAVEDGLLNDHIKVTFKDMTDGTSHTIALYEMVGRPFHRICDRADVMGEGGFRWHGPWAGNVAVNVHGCARSAPGAERSSFPSGTPFACYINCNSEFGAYSYNPG